MSENQEMKQFVADANMNGVRLDKALTEYLEGDYSRNEVQQWIKDRRVNVNGAVAKASYKLEPEDRITIMIPLKEPFAVLPDKQVEFGILYEDDMVVVVEKPAGVVVHPGHGNENGTLVNGLLAKYPDIASVGPEIARAGIVHRLDKDVSGVMVIARTQPAFDHLVLQFQERSVEKHYLALVERHPDNDKGVIDAPVGRDLRHRKRMSVNREGKDAVTEFYVRDFYQDRALLDVFPHTGRTHQIRVHLAFIKCPIVGDTVYGFRKQRIKMKRIFLHAYQLSFTHPRTGNTLTVEAPLPESLQDVLNKLTKAG